MKILFPLIKYALVSFVSIFHCQKKELREPQQNTKICYQLNVSITKNEYFQPQRQWLKKTIIGFQLHVQHIMKFALIIF